MLTTNPKSQIAQNRSGAYHASPHPQSQERALDELFVIPDDYVPTPHIVAGEVIRLMGAIGGKLEISTTSLLEVLNKQASEETRDHQNWPQLPVDLAIALQKWCRADLAAAGITAKQQRRQGKRIWAIEKMQGENHAR